MNLAETLVNTDPIAAAHSEQLLQIIYKEIDQKGPMTFPRYMELALYAEGLGYYTAGSMKFGEQGDYVTAPEISKLFSQCLAKQCRQVLRGLPSGVIFELGAGSGVMARDMLSYLQEEDSLPSHYYILELSPDLQERQQQLLKAALPNYFSNITWLQRWPDHPIQGVILANEVIDAMPVHKFQINQGIKEFYVTHNQQGLAWQLGDPSSKILEERIKQLQVHFPEFYTSEINLALPAWINSLSAQLEKGLILLLDYGFPRHEYYHSQRGQGTLMCYYHHRGHDNPLILTGIQDITAHVDFTCIAEAAVASGLSVSGYNNQASFLIGCGIGQCLEQAKNKHEDLFALRQEIKQLTLPSEMGEIVKVMGLTKDIDIPLIGFSLLDIREKL